ncbi:MAG: hypothetical protein H6598_08520 [Flavobacteriales bacterium]|nr:hypothetical protein [Flavobacteriales bacterium]
MKYFLFIISLLTFVTSCKEKRNDVFNHIKFQNETLILLDTLNPLHSAIDNPECFNQYLLSNQYDLVDYLLNHNRHLVSISIDLEKIDFITLDLVKKIDENLVLDILIEACKDDSLIFNKLCFDRWLTFNKFYEFAQRIDPFSMEVFAEFLDQDEISKHITKNYYDEDEQQTIASISTWQFDSILEELRFEICSINDKDATMFYQRAIHWIINY